MTQEARRARNREIRQRYIAGERVRDLCEEYGLTRARVDKLMSKKDRAEHKKNKEKGANSWKKERNDEIRRRYAAGDSMADLVADYGISRARIYSLMREKDKVARQEKPTFQQERKKIEVCREYLAGASVSDLVKKYNMRQDYIQKILNFGGIWIRDSAARTQVQVKKREAFLKAVETRDEPFIALAEEFGYTPERARVILAVSEFEDTREEE